jgi:hypothetical protein
MRALPFLILIGIGTAWSNTQAIWRGLTHWGGTFARTPKFRIEGRKGGWTNSSYRLRADGSIIGETLLTLYALITATVAYITGNYGVIPFAALYLAAFGTVAGLGLAQTIAPRRSRQNKSVLTGSRF